MRFIEKIIKIVLGCILPKRAYKSVIGRMDKTKQAITATPEVKWLFWILFLPLRLVFGLLAAIVKTILIWIPGEFYPNLRYRLNELYADLTQRHLGRKLSFKRDSLRRELFSKGKQRKKSFGKKNPDKTFFVIRPYYFMEVNELAPTISNLLFHYYRNLQHLTHAVNNGWIPVVDWRNYGPFPHQEDEPVNGTTDCWEYYWEQPSEYSLEEVYQSKHVILSNRNSRDYGYIPAPQMTAPFAAYGKRLATQCPEYAKLFKFNEHTQKYFDERLEQVFPSDENARILGVCVRAMSYGLKKHTNHPIQPTMEELKALIEKQMEQYSLDYCFVTCESQLVIDELTEYFGDDKLLALPRLRYTDAPTEEFNLLYEDGQKYQTNLDYLAEMFLLSKCTCFLGGMSSGTRVALIWNEDQYENTYIFDRGNWK